MASLFCLSVGRCVETALVECFAGGEGDGAVGLGAFEGGLDGVVGQGEDGAG